jgi:hypothetical protein
MTLIATATTLHKRLIPILNLTDLTVVSGPCPPRQLDWNVLNPDRQGSREHPAISLTTAPQGLD